MADQVKRMETSLKLTDGPQRITNRQTNADKREVLKTFAVSEQVGWQRTWECVTRWSGYVVAGGGGVAGAGGGGEGVEG